MKKHTTTAMRISPLFRTVGLALWLSLFFILPFFAQDSLAINLSSKEKDIESDDTPWEITADSLSYNEKEGTYHAKDNVVIR